MSTITRANRQFTLMRRSTTRILFFILRFSVLGLALAFVLSLLAPGIVDRLRGEKAMATRSEPARNLPSAGSAHSEGPVSYADAVSRAAPAVVSIYANKITTVRQFRIVPDPVTRRLLWGFQYPVAENLLDRGPMGIILPGGRIQTLRRAGVNRTVRDAAGVRSFDR